MIRKFDCGGFVELTHRMLCDQNNEYRCLVQEINKESWRVLDERWKSIECKNVSIDALSREHDLASLALRKLFVTIQERELEYGKIQREWASLITDDAKLEELYISAASRLNAFLRSYLAFPLEAFYGNIKPRSSINEKLERSADPYKDRARSSAYDVWDAVRFKIVFKNVDELQQGAVIFWRTFIDDIIRCRNYYFRPRDHFDMDSYRAIHFQLVDLAGRMVEVQFLTAYRECISLFDYPIVFKHEFSFDSEEHREWFIKAGFTINIMDASPLNQ